MLSIPLPIYIALPNRDYYHVLTKGMSCWVECEEINGSVILSMSQDALEWLGKGKDEGVSVLYGWIKNRTDEIVKQQETYTSPVTSDILGTVTYRKVSRLRVYMEIDSISLFDTDEGVSGVRALAHDAVERFVDSYSFVSSDIDVTRFSSDEVCGSVLWWTSDYSIEEKRLRLNTSAKFNYIKHVDVIKVAKRSSLFKKPRRDIKDKLSAQLEVGEGFSEYLKILLEARSLIARHQYDLSIVMSETAFEVFMRWVLIRICEQSGVSTLPGRNKKQSEGWDYVEAIQKGAVTEDLLRYLDSFAMADVKGNQICARWKRNTYDKRIEIVHGGVFGNTFDDALVAYNSVSEFIQFVLRLRYKKPQEYLS